MNCRDTKVELISNLTHSDSPISHCIQSLKYSFSYTSIHFLWPSFSLVGKNISPSIFQPLMPFVYHWLGTCGPSPTASNSMNLLVSIGDFPACTQNFMTARCSKKLIDVNVLDSIFEGWSSIIGGKKVRNSTNWLKLSQNDVYKLLWRHMIYRAIFMCLNGTFF